MFYHSKRTFHSNSSLPTHLLGTWCDGSVWSVRSDGSPIFTVKPLLHHSTSPPRFLVTIYLNPFRRIANGIAQYSLMTSPLSWHLVTLTQVVIVAWIVKSFCNDETGFVNTNGAKTGRIIRSLHLVRISPILSYICLYLSYMLS